ncbi:FtsX-like permease family protein [Halovenus sp. WSH3]|uniref:FtsX-like permease family protein n=2 Tax=Halovenus carboxidivorans TaxID=2692199 RepID=A0A6B0THW7_9EURY|nr:FtsX-like permease family protein [Halovenus carboxidivorans]
MSGGLWRLPALALAWRNLRRNRLRSVLAALGIAIGVFVIVVLGIFGTVLQLSASQELGGIGNQVIVSPAEERQAEALTPRQIQSVERAAVGRGTAVPVYAENALASAGSQQSPAQIYGIDNPAALFEGRDRSLPAQHRGGAFVGPSVASALDLQIGSTVEVGGQQYRVVGFLEPSQDITPIQPNNAIVLAEREFTGGYDQAVVVADSPEDATAVADDIDRRLNVRTDRVDIFELSELLDTIAEFFTLLNRFLIALGSVSLLVAGVSILNLMLMSTAERRGEIGLMRAVGIHRESVLRLLLAEATLLGAIGGFFGAVLSGLAALALWAVTPIGLDVVVVPRNGGYLVGGFVFGIAVALISGAYPAWKAAGERPVEALRG